MPCLCSLLGFRAFDSCVTALLRIDLVTEFGTLCSVFFIDWRCENQIRSHICVLHTGVGLRFVWTAAHITPISVRTETRGCVILYVLKILPPNFRTPSRYTELYFPLMFFCKSTLPPATWVLHLPFIPSLIIFGKVRCTLVQALRLCTGHTAHRGSRDITLLFLDHGTRRGEGSSSHPSRFLPRERTGTHCTGGWVGPRALLGRCGNFRPHRDSIPDHIR